MGFWSDPFVGIAGQLLASGVLQLTGVHVDTWFGAAPRVISPQSIFDRRRQSQLRLGFVFDARESGFR